MIKKLVDHFKVRVSRGIEVNEENIAEILRHKKDDISNYNVDIFEHVLELRGDKYQDYGSASDGENFDRLFRCALLIKKEGKAEISGSCCQFILIINCQPHETKYDYSSPSFRIAKLSATSVEHVNIMLLCYLNLVIRKLDEIHSVLSVYEPLSQFLSEKLNLNIDLGRGELPKFRLKKVHESADDMFPLDDLHNIGGEDTVEGAQRLKSEVASQNNYIQSTMYYFRGKYESVNSCDSDS